MAKNSKALRDPLWLTWNSGYSVKIEVPTGGKNLTSDGHSLNNITSQK